MASFWDNIKQAFNPNNMGGGLAVNPGVAAAQAGGGGKKPKGAPPSAAAPAAPAEPAQPAWGDLLSHQLFFNQVLAPYLNTLGQRMSAIGDQYGQQMQPFLNHVPPAYHQVLASLIPQRQNDIQQQGLGLQASAVSGPALDALMNQVNAALTEQTRAAVAGAGGGLLGSLGSLLTPAQQSQVSKQLGG